MRIIVAGAGIAGLASAIALANAGHEVTVHEQAQRIEPVGAGLQLGPNAVRALTSLGAWDRMDATACAPSAVHLHDATTGRTRTRMPLGDAFASRFGAPYRVAHRGDLVAALQDTAAGNDRIEVITGQRLSGLDLSDPLHPAVTFNGKTITCDLAIGADGVRSTMRRTIAPAVQPRITGDVLYRAMCPVTSLPDGLDPGEVHMWLGAGAHAVGYTVSGGKRFNIVVSVAGGSPVEGWNALATREQVMAAFPAPCPQLRELLSTPANWLSWTAADIEPFAGWSSGHTVLVGDAAHATLPHLAQGAAMALEDAVALAHEIGDGTGDILAALARFEAARHARTSRIIIGSRNQGRMFKMNGPAAVARNLAMRLLPARQKLDRLAWIYEG